MNRSATSPAAKRSFAENLAEMALELGVSLTLPDLVQAVSTRVRDLFEARAVVLGLSHNSVMEAVALHTNDGVISDRKLFTQLTVALTSQADSFPQVIQSISAKTLLQTELSDRLKWERVTLARLASGAGELLGRLCLADPQVSLDSEGLRGLEAVARHVSMSLENSRLFTQITQASRQWAEIFDSLSDFVVLHDDQHRVMRVNHALADFIGARPPELIGVHMRALLSKGAPAGMQPFPFCVHNGVEEFRHPALDRTYLLSTSLVHGAMNEGSQTIHVLRDVTDRHEAERRYQQLFDNVQEGVFFSTPEGRFNEVNNALVQMLGYGSREELLGIDIPTQLYVVAEERVQSHKSMAPSGEVRHKEIQFRRKDGSLMNALVNAFAVRDASGNVVQYRGTIADMTEAKRVQSQLQRERDFNLQILNNTQNMILVVDTAGLISYANRRCFGPETYGRPKLVGEKLAELVDPSDRESWNTSFDQALLGEPVDNLEVQMLLGNSALGRFSINLSPMRGAQDLVTSVVVVMTDITESSLMQAKLMNTEKLAAVGQLVSGVAHEVNNPLTAIMGFADLMLENPDLPESAHQDLKIIMQEAERTKEIVQNLLSFARQTPPRRTSVDVNVVLRRTVALRAYDLSSHGVEIIEDFSPDLPESVGDGHQLQQVFLNVLNNAYDAIGETDRQGRITLKTSVDDGFVRIDFKDNGPGISNIDRVFDPFFTTKAVGKGTGLGLSICYGIVRQHGGEVLCENNPGSLGATFTIKLPVQGIPAPASSAAAAGVTR